MENYFQQKSLNAKVTTGNSLKEPDRNTIFLELLDYGIDPLLKNQSRAYDDDVASTNYSHIISFFVLPCSPVYETRLQLLESCVEFFDHQHFFQLSVNKEEFELAISLKATHQNELTQFWIARQQPPAPVLFYTARVSAI